MSSNTVSSLSALSRQYHTISHNLANANTVGFKRRIGVFTQDEPMGAAAATTGNSGGPTGKTREMDFVDFSQGPLVHTGRSLDVALHGVGFFVVETDRGERYTRNGVFRTNAQGQLVDGAQRPVAGESGPINIPSTVSPMQIHIDKDGALSAGDPSTGQRRTIGKLRIVEFEDPKILIPVGGNAFEAPGRARPTPSTETTVRQSFQEASNVKTVYELVALIKVTRLYEANVKIIQAKGDRGKELTRVAMA